MKLVLGTVQFGLNYGINNFNGQPTREASLEMLKLAYDSNITQFDTAFAYGNAEEILGEFIERNQLKNKIKVISKLKPNCIDKTNPDHRKFVISQINDSLLRMNIEKLDGYLFHTPAYIYDDKILNALEFCKSEGLTSNIGVSVYEIADAIFAAKTGKVDYIQIPYSLFDQRVSKTDFFKIAHDNNITVYGRSAFLQGLIFMEDKNIPEHLKDAKEYLKILERIILKYGLSRLEASMLFSLNNPGIDFLVFGVDNINQLKQDIEVNANQKPTEECINELKSELSNIKNSIIFPSLWSKPNV
jgi:aryl-alcohol dehydrogenase-like predicted oxidoreductase